MMSGSTSDGSLVSSPAVSSSDAGVGIVTLRDLVEHLTDYRFGLAQDQTYAIYKRAARAGYRDLVNAYNWRYYLREYQVNLVAPYDTGTLAYDHSGGAVEYLATLAGGTFPTWATYGRLRLAGAVYSVNQRLSGTTLQLDPLLNPAGDVASTSDWVLYRNTYPLPSDFVRIQDLHNSNPWMHCYVEPDEWMQHERSYNYSGKPFRWTVVADSKRDGGFAIQTAGYPNEAEGMWFFYRCRGTEPYQSGFESKATQGTITLTEGSSSVIGVGTAFSERMVGMYLRASENGTDEPSSLDGANPYAEQHKIKTVSSATSLTLHTTPSDSLAAVKYCISDHFDIEPGMVNSLYRAAELQLAILGADAKTIQGKRETYLQALRLAVESDHRIEIPIVAGSRLGAHQGLSNYDPTQFDYGDNA
jgi:hypothetical protein